MKKLIPFVLLLQLIANCLVGQVANDICTNATPLAYGVVCNGTNSNQTLAGATDENAVPLASCMFTSGRDIWFSFLTPTSGKVEILVDILDRIPVSSLVFYSGTCDTLVEDTCVTVLSDPIMINQTFSPNTTYYLQFSDFIGDGGAFCIQLTEPGGAGTLPNDICSGAITLTMGELCDGMTLNVDNRSAKNEGVFPASSCNSFPALDDIWFSFVAPSSGQVVINVDELGQSTVADLTIYQGDCNSLQEHACSFVNAIGQDENVVRGLTPEVLYYLRVGSQNGLEGKEFCLQIREELGVENLLYQVATSHNGLPIAGKENNQVIIYNQEEAPTALELDETGTCNQTMFARVEPAGIIKLKATSGFCENGSQGPASAIGEWDLREYQLKGLTADSIPMTFTFEFSGTLDVLPDWIGCDGFGAAGANFAFDIFFYEASANSDTTFRDQSSGNVYYGWSGGLGFSQYEMENVAINSGVLRTFPSFLIDDALVDIHPFLSMFVQDYNNLSVSERNDPSLTLSNTFLSAIQDSFDLTVWDTIFQKSLVDERANFFNALNYLNYAPQIGYNPTTTQAADLRFKTKINFAYNKEVTVLINNTNLIDNSRLSLAFRAFVGTDNYCNPYTSTIDFTNTAKLINIAVPEEYVLPNANPSLLITGVIDLPIEETDTLRCNNAPLILSNEVLATGDYITTDTLTTASIIVDSTVVTFKSAKTIILQAGFHAQKGSAFSAVIEDLPDCEAQTLTETTAVSARSSATLALASTSANERLVDELQFDIIPNPFYDRTTIAYELPHKGTVSLQIFDLVGKQIAILEEGISKEKGRYEVTFQANQWKGGTYFVVLKSGEYYHVQKLILLN